MHLYFPDGRWPEYPIGLTFRLLHLNFVRRDGRIRTHQVNLFACQPVCRLNQVKLDLIPF